MRILITNDDGVHSPGLQAIAAALGELGDLAVVAPENQQSGVSHSLTLYRPLMVKTLPGYDVPTFAVEGTPADCVKLALKELLKLPPDIVVSGINNGLNTGNNVLYSGTLAGALEAAMYGYPSFAVSMEAVRRPDWPGAASIARGIIEKILRDQGGANTVFNINIPGGRIKGVAVTRQASRPWKDAFERRRDPRGRTYYWLKGSPPQSYRVEAGKGGEFWTDDHAVRQGYVSVTPLQRDMTNVGMLAELKRRFPDGRK